MRETGSVASAAPHMYPDGLCESLPRPWAAFLKELIVLPQSDSLQFLKCITLHLQCCEKDWSKLHSSSLWKNNKAHESSFCSVSLHINRQHAEQEDNFHAFHAAVDTDCKLWWLCAVVKSCAKLIQNKTKRVRVYSHVSSFHQSWHFTTFL